MSVKFIFKSLLVVALALALAGCAGGAVGTEAPYPGLGSPIPGVTEPVIETPALTEPVSGTPATTEMAETPATTEMAETPAAETEGPVTPAETQPAETMPPEGEATEALPSTGMLDPGRVSSLPGMQVYGSADEELGVVDDLIWDLASYQVAYVVVSLDVDGETRLVPAPLSVVTLEYTDGKLILSTDQETLSNAPYFSADTYPDTQQDGWDADYVAYWESQ